jgi:signal transduction histidine kinase
LILAVLGVVAVQTCLIAGLIVEHRRRRRAEIEGRQHLAAMAHLDRLAVMGELTASVAHELNQPLGAILQNAEAAKTLLDRQDPKVDTLKEIVEDIRNDDKRAREVIRRLRTLLRKHELETEPLDVNELARDTVALAAFDAGSKGVRLTVDVPSTPSIVAGDRVHLQQALLNLVLNGMEAMADVPEERRRLTVRATPNHQWIDVAVIDSGPGISQNPPSKIFEPFVTSKGDGMGMGLSIARSIVEAHGGRIDARTNDAGGATVHFTLPLQRQS